MKRQQQEPLSDVASLDLCKELNGLSGWKVWDCYIQIKDPEAPIELLSEYDNRPDRNDYVVIAPAYRLGFLLRKLQVALGVVIRYIDPDNPLATDLKEWYGKWVCYTPWLKQRDYPIANTPEDAACMLTIKFFKQEILKKEGKTDD